MRSNRNEACYVQLQNFQLAILPTPIIVTRANGEGAWAPAAHILLADDDRQTRELLSRFLGKNGNRAKWTAEFQGTTAARHLRRRAKPHKERSKLVHAQPRHA